MTETHLDVLHGRNCFMIDEIAILTVSVEELALSNEKQVKLEKSDFFGKFVEKNSAVWTN
jgi:hypothetical protein